MKKPVLLCVIPHAPAFDSCFPLIRRLQDRGLIATRTLLGKRLCRIEPRVHAAVAESGVPHILASVPRLELFSAIDILAASALLTHSDPVAYGGKFRPRDWFTVTGRKPVIFVQHGMVQSGLHLAGDKPAWDFYAGLMLLWRPLPDPDAAFFTRPVADRLTVTGMIKHDLRAPSPRHAETAASLAAYRQRVLICHNFGFEQSRYPQEAARQAFAVWSEVAGARPDTAFLIRSHRGKKHPDFEADIAALCALRPNVYRSERHHGLMQMATIRDMLCLVERVITHPSSVVLDAAYNGTPVAVFGGTLPELDRLPRADTPTEIGRFLDDADADAGAQQVKNLYGDIDRNLDRAAEAVEGFMSQRG